MRLAFCHNLKTSDSIEESEYDTQDTVDRIAAALESGGHEVVPVNVGGELSRVAAELEAIRPDLIFNTAEGRGGRLREAFFPALYEHLGIPFTGGDSFCCALTLDKLGTKERVRERGVPTPRAVFLTPRTAEAKAAALRELSFPVIAKPNFEGSSVGISTDSVFSSREALQKALPGLLKSFPAGILVEEFIEGRDITVGFLEALEPPILDPTGYVYHNRDGNPHNIYDFRLKNHSSEDVEVVMDVGLEAALIEKIRGWAFTCARALEVRDVGRFDFRLARDSTPYFLEANATPSLEDGAGLILAAGKRGLSYKDAILAIVDSAARRAGILEKSKARGKSANGAGRRKHLKVGLTFNLKRSDTTRDDSEAEFDSPKTIAGLRGALEELGHEVQEFEATSDLPLRLAHSEVDIVFNIAEGLSGRNREAQVPALCELLRIPHTGSDVATLSLCLDKALCKRILLQAGIPTPGFAVVVPGKEKFPKDLRYPLIAKPNAEGTSKGLDSRSVVESEEGLREQVRRLIERYRQPVIIEEYVIGRELTVGLVGWPRPKLLAPMEMIIKEPGVKHPVYHYKLKQDFTEFVEMRCPAELSDAESRALEKVARDAFGTLGCLDVARIDFRLAGGVPYVIEVNPLPGLNPGFSDLCLIAEHSGLPYLDLIREIFSGALRRTRAGTLARSPSR
jgi:D-alanine-D-alanine ligase